MGVVDKLFGKRSWFLKNEDTNQEIQGQFEPLDLTENISQNYAKHKGLNRENPVVQFISGNERTITFRAVLHARDMAFKKTAVDDFETLREWGQRDPEKERPPILSFWVGDKHVSFAQCVIESLGGISYGRPDISGGLKTVTFNIQLLKYTAFSLEGSSAGETRYHRAKLRDYYEFLALREYNNPMIGDVIRKRHPSKPNLQVADVVKLPSASALRKEKVEPKSIALQTSYGRRETPQRALRLAMFDLRNRSYVSHVLVE